LEKTENFEIISNPKFWEPIFLTVNKPDICVMAFMFPMKLLNPNSFSADFVEMFAKRLEEMVPLLSLTKCKNCDEETCSKVVNNDWAEARFQVISQRILETNQRNFFLKLISELPESMQMIIEKPDLSSEQWKTLPIRARVTALVNCANCDAKESSEKQFLKCSRCGFAHYCSKSCQIKNWASHKERCI
jgi:hypothetical protein